MRNSISKKQLRDFGILIGMALPILIGWIIPAIFGHIFRIWTLWIGIPIFILGICCPALLIYPYKVWMSIGNALGFINSRIILGLVFVIVLQPIAFFMRLGGYDPLKKRKNKEISYRENKNNQKVNLTRIF